MSDNTKKLLSALLAAVAATVISFLTSKVVPNAPAVLQPTLTAALVAAAHYVDAWGSAEAAARKAAKLAGPALLLLFAVGFAHSVSACGLFSSSGPIAPVVEKCAPTEQALLTEVGTILLSGGSGYLAQLEQLVLTDGENAVECAVQAFIAEANGKPTAERQAAVARAKAYLASKAHK